MDTNKNPSTNNEEQKTNNPEENTVLNQENNKNDDINDKLKILAESIQKLTELQKTQLTATSINNVRVPEPVEEVIGDSWTKKIKRVIDKIDSGDLDFQIDKKNGDFSDVMIAIHLVKQMKDNGEYNIKEVENKMKRWYVQLEQKEKDERIQSIYQIRSKN